MEATGAPYADVLAEAQRLGYAEADPRFDVGGVDAAQKLALLVAIAFGTRVDFAGVAVEGIERVSLADIEHAAELGYRIKLLGVARLTGDGLEARMQPCLVPAASPLGRLEGVTNMVVVEGDFVGRDRAERPRRRRGADRLGDPRRRDRHRPRAGHARLRPAGREPGAAAARRRRGRGGLLPALRADRRARRARAGRGGARGRRASRSTGCARSSTPTEEAPVLIVTHRTGRAALDRALAEIAGARRLPRRAGRDPHRGGLSRLAVRDVRRPRTTWRRSRRSTPIRCWRGSRPSRRCRRASRRSRARAAVLARGLPHLVAERRGAVLASPTPGLPHRAPIASPSRLGLCRRRATGQGIGAGC